MNKIDRQRARLGYLYVALAAILFAISGTSAKFLFNDGITAFQLIQMRTTLAFTGLLIWLCLRYPALLKISLKNLPYFIGLGVFGIGSAQFFYLLAISKINVAAAILLHYTGPVFAEPFFHLGSISRASNGYSRRMPASLQHSNRYRRELLPLCFWAK
jgi:drug/metabolite transporter (DMT)-like permease